MAEPAENLTQSQDVAVKPQLTGDQAIVVDDSDFSMLLDSAKFNQAWRAAKMFADSKMVPAHFQGATASVFVVMHMAVRLGVDPMMLMQNTYMVHGRPGMEAKLQIALVNSRGPFTGPIKWEFSGDNKNRTRSCTAYAKHRKTGERHQFTVDWAMVQAERWDKKEGSKWLTMPDLMFMYRSASFLIKTTCPEVTMGLPTVEELQDMDNVIEIAPEEAMIEGPIKETKAEVIKEKLKRGRKPAETPKDTPVPDPAPEAQAEKKDATTDSTEPTKAIQLETVSAILKAQDGSGISVADACEALKIDVSIPLAELDEVSGQRLLGYYKSR